jgi:peptidoglycan/xylan/chitin deacetylase (PgdA/CDA1 family)
MPPSPPHYFSALGPFAELFQTGVPVLTYHKVGPRPPRVRLKGLYLNPRLFAAQLAGLRAAGFRSVSPGEVTAAADNQARRLALTFDDGCLNVLTHALAPLADHGFHAIQFLVADRLGQTNDWEQREGEAPELLMSAAEVRDWLAAGHQIGSHTLTHPHLTRLAPARAREEIAASRRKLEDTFGVAVEHFCYPYGDWNLWVRDLVAEAGYRTACTVEFGVNTAATPPLELRRITARYPTRNLRALTTWLRQRLSQ